MGLLPVNAADQLDPGRIGPQLAIEAKAAGTGATAQHNPGQQGAALHQLMAGRIPAHRQGMVAIVGRQIPGIPELALISEAS